MNWKECEEDRELDRLAATLRESVEAPGLWPRIEAALAAERPRRSWRLPVAAAALLAVAVFLQFLPRFAPVEPGLLLEESAARGLDGELADLEARWRILAVRLRECLRPGDVHSDQFRDQVAYLDANIERCRRLAASNPLNRKVRDALLRSARGKVAAAREFLGR